MSHGAPNADLASLVVVRFPLVGEHASSGTAVGGTGTYFVIMADVLAGSTSARTTGDDVRRTLNLNRLAPQGMICTDYYAKASCTPVVRIRHRQLPIG
jgi:hypothetical protein